jgi:acetyl esterase/lipase
MSLTLDPEIAAVLAARAAVAEEAGVAITLPARGDALGLREMLNPMMLASYAQADPAPDVMSTVHDVRTEDGETIEARWYVKDGTAPGSAVVYIHGGGMICGSIEAYDPAVRQYVQWTGVPFLSVEYRLAPEFPGETPARDAYAGLRHLLENASGLGVDPSRIAIMGDSGGGGVGAAAAILARDNGIDLARQILIYPMLDDRNIEPDPHLQDTTVWTYDMNFTGWHALLGDKLGTSDVSPIATPARLTDFGHLAPAYIEVGALDIFRDESIGYANRLLRAGIDTELHVHPGAPHGHDWIGFTAKLTQRCNADRIRVIASL